MHWPPIVQAVPFGLRLQLLGALPWQVSGVMQSLSVVQEVLHAPAPHTYGEQSIPFAGAQVPVPLQFDDGVKVDPLQLDMPHEVFVSAC
jgi:hypothetical protein